MNKKLASLLLTLIVFSLLSISSCSNNEDPNEPAISHPSHRDGTFSGSKLTVTLNGTKVESANTAVMKSELLNSNPYPDGLGSNPTFTSKIIIYGFPGPKDQTTLNTVTDLMGFKDEVTLNDKKYIYTGTFTGTPLLHHDNQGLIIDFVNK